jgi:hypothetical protein
MNWEAKSQMQRDVLESDAMIVCAGGSAGTYKSETLLVDAAQERWKPKFHGILFRESFPELSRALIPRARALYSQMGATYNSQEHSFRWPSGAVIRFAYLSCDDDVHQHQGPRYSWIGIDESTHMTEFRIRYLLSRLGSHHGAWHLYGHSHGNLPDTPTSLSMDVGVDTHDFQPWHFDEINLLMTEKAKRLSELRRTDPIENPVVRDSFEL